MSRILPEPAVETDLGLIRLIDLLAHHAHTELASGGGPSDACANAVAIEIVRAEHGVVGAIVLPGETGVEPGLRERADGIDRLNGPFKRPTLIPRNDNLREIGGNIEVLLALTEFGADRERAQSARGDAGAPDILVAVE